MILNSLIDHLNKGGVAVLQTDTVLGLVARADFPSAVAKLYQIKGREGKPGTIIASSTVQLRNMGLNPDEVERASTFWPGPNSIVLSAPGSLAYLHFGLGSLAVRIPNNKRLIKILQSTGPLATTSANLPGHETSKSIEEAKKLFGNNVFYDDSPTSNNTEPSKIYILLESGEFERLR